MEFKAYQLRGIDPVEVTVKVETHGSFAVEGLSDVSARETRVRVRGALLTIGVDPDTLTNTRVVVEGHVGGGSLDLLLALALLARNGTISEESLRGVVAYGELSLDGTVRSTRGVLPMLDKVPNVRTAFVPAANREEASYTSSGARVHAVEHVEDIVAVLTTGSQRCLVSRAPLKDAERHDVDLSDLRGLGPVKRALEVAAAGGHGILLVGPPGCGRTMLARRLLTILPALDERTLRESLWVRSATGLNFGPEKPFRAPYHTVSPQGLAGGGVPVRPGEVSLAHGGVLFLDDLPEFRASALDAIRMPVEEGMIAVHRKEYAWSYPAAPHFAAAMSPCPCGFNGETIRECKCSPARVEAYVERALRSPVARALPIRVRVPIVGADFAALQPSGESSAVVRERVARARERQDERQGKLNSRLCQGDDFLLASSALFSRSKGTTATIDTTRVARTIADLARSTMIETAHYDEARALTSMYRAA